MSTAENTTPHLDQDVMEPDPATATAVEMLQWLRSETEEALADARRGRDTCRQWAAKHSEFEARAVQPDIDLFERRIKEDRRVLTVIDDALDADDPESAAGHAMVQLGRHFEGRGEGS
jgi:hypothetical protein